VTAQVLHADLVLLREDVTDDARQALFDEAASLTALPGIAAIGVIEGMAGSDFDLAFFFVLDSFANLETFGTDARYIRFLQGGVARSLKSFGGADIQLMEQYRGAGRYAALAALAASPQTYDWQVRDALAAWAGGPQSTAGLAVGERQRYRGLGIMFSDDEITRPTSGFEGFGLDFVTGACRLLS
jgi:hypothetical protein